MVLWAVLLGASKALLYVLWRARPAARAPPLSGAGRPTMSEQEEDGTEGGSSSGGSEAEHVMEARVARSADTVAQPNAFENLLNVFNTSLQQFSSAIQRAVQGSLPSQEEVKQNVQTGAQTFANNIEQLSNQIKEKTQQMAAETREGMTGVAAALDRYTSQLRAQFPDAAEGATKLKTTMEGAVAEVQRVQELLQPHADSIAESVKSAGRTVVEQATVLANQMQQTIQQAGQAPH